VALSEYFKVGYVAKTHGLKGEVTLALGNECPDLHQVEILFLEMGSSAVPYFIEAVSLKGDKAFIKLEDVNTIEQATALKGKSVLLPKSDRPKLAKGEFYNDEVLGFMVTDEENGDLGTVREVEETGPNRFLVVDYLAKAVMIPVNGPFIKSINKTKKRITVSLPEGFLDL